MRTRLPAGLFRRSVFGAFLCVLGAPAAMVAQEPALPSASDLAARHVAAMGGEAAQKAVKSMRVRGLFEMADQNLSGTLEMLTVRPNKMLVRVDIPGVGHIETGYDGHVGWVLDPQMGPLVLSGRQLLETTDDAWFDGTLHGPEHVREMTTLARTTFGDREAYKVKVVFVSGREQTEYFDAEKGWQIGAEGARETALGVLPTKSVFSDFRRFGALMQPTRLVQSALGLEQTFHIESVEYDVVRADAFDLPPAIKALIKK
jgi:hypothetical protein